MTFIQQLADLHQAVTLESAINEAKKTIPNNRFCGKGTTNREKIRLAVGNQWMKLDKVVDKTGLRRRQVSSALSHLIEEGRMKSRYSGANREFRGV